MIQRSNYTVSKQHHVLTVLHVEDDRVMLELNSRRLCDGVMGFSSAAEADTATDTARLLGTPHIHGRCRWSLGVRDGRDRHG